MDKNPHSVPEDVAYATYINDRKTRNKIFIRLLGLLDGRENVESAQTIKELWRAEGCQYYMPQVLKRTKDYKHLF